MENAVEDGGGQCVVAEDFAPAAEVLIGSDDQRTAFVSAADLLKEQIGAEPVEKYVGDLIDDQQFGWSVLPEFSSTRFFGVGLGSAPVRPVAEGNSTR